MKKQLLICALTFLGINTAVVSYVKGSCNTPTGFHTSTINNNSATVEWTPTSGISYYNFRYRKVDMPTWIYVTCNRSNAVLTGLAADVSYECEVQIICGNGNSAFTEAIKFRTLSQPITTPTAMPVTSINGGSATVSWTTMPASCNYVLQWKETTSNGWITYPGNPRTPCLIGGLRACTSYQFRVQNVCPTGSSNWSNTGTFITTCPTPPNTGSHTPRMMNTEEENTVSINAYPNPVVDNLTIEYNSVNTNSVKTNVYNILGNLVTSQVTTVEEGKNLINLNTSELSGGIYFFEIDNNGDLIRSKFMVSK